MTQQKTQERINCAAIWYKNLPTVKYLPTNISQGIVVEGHRHADIIRTVLNLIGKGCSSESEYGFITDTDRFVNRFEAMDIARKANQIISNTTFPELYSEDLY